MGQLRIWKLCCIVRNKCITAQQGFIAGHAEVAIRPSLICQVSRDIKQISLSNIYPFDIHKIKHMSWFENETKQYQMLLLCINSWSNYCLKAAVLSPQSVWLLGKKKKKKIYPQWWKLSQRSLFASVSMGQYWNSEGWKVESCSSLWAWSQKRVHIIPILLVQCLAVNPRQV